MLGEVRSKSLGGRLKAALPQPKSSRRSEVEFTPCLRLLTWVASGNASKRGLYLRHDYLAQGFCSCAP